MSYLVDFELCKIEIHCCIKLILIYKFYILSKDINEISTTNIECGAKFWVKWTNIGVSIQKFALSKRIYSRLIFYNIL